jgi:hypothetical protein
VTAVWIALIVAVPSLIGPWIVTRAAGRERRKDMRAEWRRQDAVAAQAAEAAALLLAAQRDAIVRTDAVAARLAETDRVTNDKLDAIHVLVNQKLTDATAAALAATAALLAALEESVAYQVELGRAPTASSLERIEEARRDVAALRATLAERAARQAEVDTAGG